MNNEKLYKLKNIISEYLSEDAEIKGEINNDNVEIGYIFEHPTGIDPSGNPVGRPFTIVKPKDKNFININNSTKNIKNSLFNLMKS